MSQWYYARAGTQHGPVPESELRRLAASGGFDPTTDLVWRDGMAEWKPAASVAELSFPDAAGGISPPVPATAPPSAEALNPYAAPATPELHSPVAPGEEIEPGSQPIDIGACISRGFEIAKRNLGLVIGAGAVYFGVTMAFGMATSFLDMFFGINNATNGMEVDPETGEMIFTGGAALTPGRIAVTAATNIASWLLNTYLALGATRIGLNLIDGRPANIAMLFGESSKLARGVGAGLIYVLATGVGLVLFIVPGVIIGLRWSQYMNAIVDRDMGITESLKYSTRLTTNTSLRLLGLYIISFLIMLAGLMLCLVGSIFTYPLGFLILIVAYRWMQFGSGVSRDSSV